MSQDRNTALRIAYRHAKNGRAAEALRWRNIAAEFAELTPRQLKHLDACLSAGSGIHPDQLELEAA